MQQEKIDFIKEKQEQYYESAIGFNKNNFEEDQKLIKEIAAIALEEQAFDDSIRFKLKNKITYYSTLQFLEALLNSNIKSPTYTLAFKYWSVSDTLIKNLLTKDLILSRSLYSLWRFICNKLTLENGDEPKKLLEYLNTIGIPEDEIIKRIIASSNNPFIIPQQYSLKNNMTSEESGFAEFLKPKLTDNTAIQGLKKSSEKAMLINKLFAESQVHNKNHKLKSAILKFLYTYAPDSLEGYFQNFTINSASNSKSPNYNCINFLINEDSNKFEKEALFVIEQFKNDEKVLFSIYNLLNEPLNGKYHNQLCAIGEKEIDLYVNAHFEKDKEYKFRTVNGGELPIVYSTYLLKRNEKEGKERLLNFVINSAFISTKFLQFLDKYFAKDSVPFLIEAMMKDHKIIDPQNKHYEYYNKYYITLFQILDKYDISNYLDQVIDYARTKTTSEEFKKQAMTSLTKYISTLTDRALQLISSKSTDDRFVGILLLCHSKDDHIVSILMKLVETERNEKNRDFLLKALNDVKFKKDYTLVEVLEMIDNADKRKKLSRWGEKLVSENDLPKLFWKESGEKLNLKQIRFLFYRCKKEKYYYSREVDPEAKQMTNKIDKLKSTKFATSLLQTFQNNDSDLKLRYYLIIVGLIGNDNILPKIHNLFRKAISSNRYILGELLIKNMAKIGSNRALRLIDMISRKYSERFSIEWPAKEVLKFAALEYNISPEELSDRIIPNFDFENLYKTFKVNGHTYRAFVSKDFKLYYFNEDNKLSKTIPKGTSKVLMAELKSIDKEIKEVVRNQKGRLENFLVNERKWSVNHWLEYYLNNPIMLIYVQRLIWGLYKNDRLITVFYCDDDIGLYDIEDDEIDLDKGDTIGIVHPLHMSATQINRWKSKVYEMDIDFEFPILDRTTTLIAKAEKDKTTSTAMMNTDVPKGADFVANFLMKKGWIKESGDGGRLNFYKMTHSKHIKAYANIEGPQVFYQGGNVKATIHEVYFTDLNERKSIKLKDVPKVFYSEVMADLKSLAEA